MLIVRGDSGMAAANPAFAALLEGAPADWNPLATLLPGAGELAARILDGSLAQASTELELPTRLQLALSPVCDADGAVVGVLGVAAPLPAPADQAARELGRLVELSPVGVVRYTLDGDILDCNDAFLSMLGLTQDDRRRGLSWRALTPPEWRDADDAGLARLQAHGLMPLIEKEFLHRDGRRIPVLVGAGNLLADRRQGFGVVIDISATRAAERALAESEARFRAITNAMPQMVWSTRADGFHDYYNDPWYEFTGMVPGSTDGVHWADVFHPEDRDRAWHAWRHSLASGDTYEIQYRLRDRHGNYRWVLGRALPVRDDSGAIVRWMGTCTDIDDQKMAENALRLANQRKDDFLAMLAHELRNPLAPISTAAQVLRLRQGDTAYALRAGEIIERQVRHMTELVDDLLDVSRVTRGLVQMAREPVELRAVVDSAVEQVRPLIEARHHVLAVDLPAQPAFVAGDRTRLVQAVSNLLNNAAKYTQQHGSLRVALRLQDGQAAISVADNGSGMPPGLLPHVFDLFTQGERTPDRAQGGLGLGLTLVKSIAQLHGGAVTADSEGQGQGSVFTITLPVIAAPAAQAPSGVRLAGHAPLACARQPLRITVVDDNRDAGASLAAALEAQGHVVALFDDAEALLADAGPAAEAYILDIGLPRIDGYQLARELRARAASRGALLIALTGYGQAHDFTLSKGAGFDHHLVKPANLEQLDRILAGWPAKP